MLPSFDGCVGEILIPDALIEVIGYDEPAKGSMHHYSQLRGHCQDFGCYVRFLGLQNIFCSKETCQLLANSKLQGLFLRRISSNMHTMHRKYHIIYARTSSFGIKTGIVVLVSYYPVKGVT